MSANDCDPLMTDSRAEWSAVELEDAFHKAMQAADVKAAMQLLEMLARVDPGKAESIHGDLVAAVEMVKGLRR